MNDTAEGLISFLSAHETLGDAGRLMGRGELTWHRFVWKAQRVRGTECTVSQIHLAVSALDRMEAVFDSTRSPLLTVVWPTFHPWAPQHQPNTINNNLHFVSLTERCIICPGLAAAHAKTERSFDIGDHW